MRPLTGRLDATLTRDGQVRIWWNSSLPGVLQTAPEITGPFAEAELPVEADDINTSVTLKPQARRAFFRLLLTP